MRTIYGIRVIEMQGRKVLFEADVQAGTYIRNLCVDVGRGFGGGFMAELRRTHVGKFGEGECVRLPDLEDAVHECSASGSPELLANLIKPSEHILTLPALRVRQEALDAACRGLPLAVSGVASVEAVFARGEYVALLNERGVLYAVGIADISSGEFGKRKKDVIAVNPKIVLV